MRIILILLSFLFCKSFLSQSISPFVISSSGNHFTGGNHQLSWTMGEPIVNTLSIGNSVLTQGFHQPYNSLFTTNETENMSVSISVFPNPANESIKIVFPHSGSYHISLNDLLGKEISAFRLNNESFCSVDISDLSCGSYFLRISTLNQQVLSLTKIFKQ